MDILLFIQFTLDLYTTKTYHYVHNVTNYCFSANETQRGNSTLEVLDITNVDYQYKNKLDELWTAIQYLQIKAAAYKHFFLSTINPPVLLKQLSFHLNQQSLSIPGSGKFIE